MAGKSIDNLTAITTPASTDEFACLQSGDAEAKKQTRAEIHALESGEHFILPQVDEASTPTLAFGDGNTGIYENGDNQLNFSFAGSNSAFWTATGLFMGNAAGGAVLNAASTATVPTFSPSRSDTDTGIGAPTADQLSIIAGAVEGQRISQINDGTNDDILHTFNGNVVADVTDASTAAAAATLTKAGEDFDTTVSVGDVVWVFGGTTAADFGAYIVITVTSATVLTVDRNFGNTNTDVDFFVMADAIYIENSRDRTAKLVLPPDNDVAAPTLSFGDGDTGIFESSDDNLAFGTAGVLRMVLDSTGTLDIDKLTADEGLINFKADIGGDATSAISSFTTSATTTHHIQIELNGATAWIACSTTDPTA